jgi:hypothetical protein
MKDEMGGACGTYECIRNVYRVLVWIPEGKRILGKTWALMGEY